MPGVPPTLDSEQHKLWTSCPDVAHRAVDGVVAELGAPAPFAEMFEVAVRGTVEAAVTYDAQRGGTYRDWALFYASLRVWEWLRRAHGDDKIILARIRIAMFRFLAHDHWFVDPWATRASSRQTLQGFSDGLLMVGHLMIGGEPIGGRGEEDLLEIEAVARAVDALRLVTGELTPEQRRLLERCHAYGKTVKEAAKEGAKGYRAVLRAYHDLLALMGARLGALGIKRTPPWRAEVADEVFDEPEAPASEDPQARGAVSFRG